THEVDLVSLRQLLVDFLYTCLQVWVCNVLVFSIEDQPQARNHFVYFAAGSNFCRISGVLEIVKMDDIFIVYPNGINTQIAATVTKHLSTSVSVKSCKRMKYQ